MANSTERLPKPRHILELEAKEKIDFIQSIDTVISDMDGVLWNIVSGIDGAADGFKALTNAGKKLFFMTNNSIRSEDIYEKRLKEIGLEINYENIINPVKIIVEYLKSINFDGLIYFIGVEVVKDFICKAGFKVIDGPNNHHHENISDLLKHVCDKEPVRAVITDFDYNISGAKMMRAHQYLRHPDCILICAATDLIIPITKELHVLGQGPYAKVLAETSGKTPIIVGKPGKDLAKIVVDRLDIRDKSRAIMIGDTLEQDIGFGKVAGLKTLLVLTGVSTKEKMLENTNPDHHPDYYADSIEDFVKFFESTNLI